VEDFKDDDIESSYQCKVFVDGNPPRVVAIDRVYPRGSTIHTVLIQSDFSRVVVENVRYSSAIVLMPTSEVNTVGERLGTFNVWPSHMIKTVSKNYQVYFIKGY